MQYINGHVKHVSKKTGISSLFKQIKVGKGKVQICMRMRPSFCKGPPDLESGSTVVPSVWTSNSLVVWYLLMESIAKYDPKPPKRAEWNSSTPFLAKVSMPQLPFLMVLMQGPINGKLAPWKRIINLPTPILGLAEAETKSSSMPQTCGATDIYIYNILCSMYVYICICKHIELYDTMYTHEYTCIYTW